MTKKNGSVGHNYNLRSRKTSDKSLAAPIRSTKSTKKENKKDGRNKMDPKLAKASIPACQAVTIRPIAPPSTLDGTLHAAKLRTPQHTLEDVIGIDHIKDLILQCVIRPFARPEFAEEFDVPVPKGILLTGQPGTGKTALADAIVDEVRRIRGKVNYFMEAGSCLSEFLGETEKNIRNLFELAHKHAPSVIFLDEIDGLARKRSNTAHGEAVASIMATLLIEIGKVKNGDVLLIAATNCPESLDKALIRPERFDHHVEVPLPDEAGRKAILRFYLKGGRLSEENLDKVAAGTANCTGCHLKDLCKKIRLNSVKRVLSVDDWDLDLDDEDNQEIIKQKKQELQNIDFNQDVVPALQTIKP